MMLLLSVLEELVSELPWDSVKPDLRLHVSLNFSRRGRILLLPKEASMLHSETWEKMTGDGTCTILSRDPIGWAIKMPFTTCVEKLPRQSWN